MNTDELKKWEAFLAEENIGNKLLVRTHSTLEDATSLDSEFIGNDGLKPQWIRKGEGVGRTGTWASIQNSEDFISAWADRNQWDEHSYISEIEVSNKAKFFALLNQSSPL